MGFHGGSAYCAAKFAVVGLSESLNHELNQFGIEVAAVAPGAFRTDFRDASSMHCFGSGMTEESKSGIMKRIRRSYEGFSIKK